ncbi:MAG: hypothetical protein GY854_32030 [Deltaproteobacteria bacterium]|nr:hypothetical protein [Deltaproteobacteria bacterium]
MMREECKNERYSMMKEELGFRIIAILLLGSVVLSCSGKDNDDNNVDNPGPDASVDASSDAAGGDECAALVCGENASCQTEDTAKCVCNEGYLGDGDDCEAAGSWILHEIGDQTQAIYVYTADIDGDSERDLVVTSSDHTATFQSEIAWYRNEGSGASWTKFVVSPADGDDPIIASNGVVAADLNKDGRQDVVVASGPTMGAASGGVHLLLGPDDPTGEWEKTALHTVEGESFFKIYALDVNGDDFLDIVAGGNKAGLIALNPADSGGDWTIHRMNEDTGGGLYAADFDGDGNVTVISANAMSHKVFWTDVTAEGDTLTYQDTLVAEIQMPLDIYAIDVNQDDHADVLCTRIGGRGFRWFENPGDGSENWTEHMIRENFSGTDIYVGDIDGDNADDVIVSGLTMMEADKLPTSTAWFSIPKDDPTVEWDIHWVDYANPVVTAPGDVELFDINGDGKLDVVTTSLPEGKVYWYENNL